jgi:hypothetical protein
MEEESEKVTSYKHVHQIGYYFIESNGKSTVWEERCVGKKCKKYFGVVRVPK